MKRIFGFYPAALVVLVSSAFSTPSVAHAFDALSSCSLVLRGGNAFKKTLFGKIRPVKDLREGGVKIHEVKDAITLCDSSGKVPSLFGANNESVTLFCAAPSVFKKPSDAVKVQLDRLSGDRYAVKISRGKHVGPEITAISNDRTAVPEISEESELLNEIVVAKVDRFHLQEKRGSTYFGVPVFQAAVALSQPVVTYNNAYRSGIAYPTADQPRQFYDFPLIELECR